MACGGCAKKSIAKKQASSTSSQPQAVFANGEDLVLMEYVGDKAGSLNYKGPTGQIYRFGSMAGENQKFIHPDDVEHFLSMRDFHVIQKEAPVESAS